MAKKPMTIKIDGKSLPCFPTMGAMLRFKEETGRDVTEVKPHEVSAVCVYMWCCVKSACAREGEPFDYTVQDFLDRVDPASLAAWQESQADENGEEEV